MNRTAPYWQLSLVSVAAAMGLAACGPEDGSTAYSSSHNVAATKTAAHSAPKVHTVASAPIGTVASIEPITRTDKPSGTGAVVGGVLGAVVGHQFGGGDGKKLATAAGAVGGAVVGNQVEKQRSETVVGYRVDVRMEDGSVRSFQPSSVGNLTVGSRVRVESSGAIKPA